MSVLPVGFGSAAGGTPAGAVERSLRFNSADSAYLNRTPASAGNRKTWTWSGWVKRGTLGSYQYFFHCGTTSATGNYGDFGFDSNDKFYLGVWAGPVVITNMTFRDPSAWYHIVVSVDTTQATAANRFKLYVNGTQVISYATDLISTYYTLNYDTAFNQALQHSISSRNSYTTDGYFNGYMTEINFIDGQALTPSDFGETDSATGVWKPKAYSGTYGTNGFYLKFADNSGTTSTTLGKDSSGNGNNWTPNNFSVTAGVGNDSLVDSPTNYGTDTGVGGEVRGNYCTWNPLDNGGQTLSNGNLDISRSGASWLSTRASFGISSGKWYWEITPTTALSSNLALMIGLMKQPASLTSYVGADANGWGYYSFDGTKYTSASSTAYGSTYTNNDVIGIAFDADAGTLTFYKNNTSQGQAFSGLTSGPYFPAISGYATTTVTAVANFGQRPFAYTAPSGFKALCTQNLPTPTIGATSTTQANDYFDIVTWTGNGTNPRSITGVGFQPDFVWAKSRSDAFDNTLYDAVRGAGKVIYSSTNLGEATNNTFGYLSSFNSDGFTTSAGATNNSYFNTNNSTYVAWNWKANGAGSSNTAGTITSTVSANTTSGFSIAKFNAGSAGNKTVGHGLGVTPSLWMVKCLSTTGTSWSVGSSALTTPASNYLVLNATSASTSDTRIWANAAPTSTVFSFESNYTLPANSDCVAYCFAPVAGYSAFGSYTGNGSTDGPFVFTNFRPRYLMVKEASGTSAASGNWVIHDAVRDTYNVCGLRLVADNSYAEGTVNAFDFLSNGFKLRTTDVGRNESGGTYIYMALAENPFKYSLGR